MAIPELTPDGVLPPGHHICTIDEIAERFGRFNESDQRPRLMKFLHAYAKEVQEAGVGKCLIVDGSFITDKPKPSDIDLLLVLRDDINLDEEVPPFRYNPRSKRYVRKKFPFDIFIGFDGDLSATEPMDLFTRVKHRPGETKGLLKVVLHD